MLRRLVSLACNYVHHRISIVVSCILLKVHNVIYLSANISCRIRIVLSLSAELCSSSVVDIALGYDIFSLILGIIL